MGMMYERQLAIPAELKPILITSARLNMRQMVNIQNAGTQ